MTAAEIRQSFFDFFKDKQHTIVPSASLLPQSPGLLFTNAGMNQFVPYFLGTEKAPYSPPRAADTQKCIRAGGKHNDLDDVGYDTYHHTFFEMLGNWSFGDYFKAEAIQWSWELIVEHWGFPADRLYATVYQPDKAAGDPGNFDQEGYDLWAKLYESKGLDPKKHIVNGSVKDNFWMMGDTGPCGPCSELHVDLTPNGDTDGKLVNMDSDQCIEIWNLVFIQFNAEADGSFRDLPSKHIDTGMGFERACSIYQGTKAFTNFSKRPSNYATDVFTPLFEKLEQLSGKPYQDIYPESVETDKSTLSDDIKLAVAFRVIADHIRTLSFSIADGILPGNTGRNYVLRRILRRAVRYGRTLGFDGNISFLPQLVETLANQLGDVFPELIARKPAIIDTLAREEESFNRTLDRGLELFNTVAVDSIRQAEHTNTTKPVFPPEEAFKLYDTFGFPIDLTVLLCQEKQIHLNESAVEEHMEEARKLSQAAQKKTVVRALDVSSDVTTEFTGYDEDSSEAKVVEIHENGDQLLIITDRSPFYVEMGGQVGDTGILTVYNDGNPSEPIDVTSVQKIGNAIAHAIPASVVSASCRHDLNIGDTVALTIHTTRRRPIEAHHTATHLLHWALHEVVSTDATQQGSHVSTERLRFDFTSGALTPEQLTEIELLVNKKITSGDGVFYNEVPHADIKDRKDVMQFFGDKYGDLVRVVQIGGGELGLDGYSMELCGGTHVNDTKEIGMFKIRSEGAIASGVRRIEAVCGESAWDYIRNEVTKRADEENELRKKLDHLNQTLIELGGEKVVHGDFPHIMGAMLVEGSFEDINSTFNHFTHHVESLKLATIDAEKSLKKAQTAAAAKVADDSLNAVINNESADGFELLASGNLLAHIEGSANLLQELLNGLKKKQFKAGGFLIVDDGEKLHLGAYCGPNAIASGTIAGDLIKNLAPIAGGRGGGKPDQARGAAPERDKVSELKRAASHALK